MKIGREWGNFAEKKCWCEMKKIMMTGRGLVVWAMCSGAFLAVLGENPENLTDSMAKVRQAEEKESAYMKLVQRAEESTEKGDWESAIAYLQEAMRSEPSNAQNVLLLSNVGMMQFYMGEDSLALHTLTEARAMAPASVVILNNRARVLTQMERFEDALRDYELILSMDSTYAAAYQDRAAIELRQGRVDRAEADVAKFRELKPKDSQGKLLQAVIYGGSGRRQDAISLYGELLREKEESVLYAARAMCYMEEGDLAAAAEDIARGLELDPKDAELYYCRAYLNRLRYRDEDARADAKQALELGLNPMRVKALFEGKR